ncbi:disease resistance protein RPV1-like [Castanea sativa]|uniref:disease resistance protein RPV1-like n=1 Tax=Castanea sativa TaxID=21020 RepID=UPI003F6498B5
MRDFVKALDDKRINTFIENDLRREEEILEELLRAMEMAVIFIIVISENFAFSTWCLNEFVKILECKRNDQLVLPIFYKVDPVEICSPNGNFGVALAKHEKFEENMENVQRWKAALNEVASLPGLHYNDESIKSKFIQGIAGGISSRKLNYMRLIIAQYLAGLDSCVEDITSFLDRWSNDVLMLEIHGHAGVDITTTAKTVYNKIAGNFEGSIFLENDRGKSGTTDAIIQLQIFLRSLGLNVNTNMLGP